MRISSRLGTGVVLLTVACAQLHVHAFTPLRGGKISSPCKDVASRFRCQSVRENVARTPMTRLLALNGMMGGEGAGLGGDLLLTDVVVGGGLVLAAVKAFESRLKERLFISSVLQYRGYCNEWPLLHTHADSLSPTPTPPRRSSLARVRALSLTRALSVSHRFALTRSCSVLSGRDPIKASSGSILRLQSPRKLAVHSRQPLERQRHRRSHHRDPLSILRIFHTRSSRETHPLRRARAALS